MAEPALSITLELSGDQLDALAARVAVLLRNDTAATRPLVDAAAVADELGISRDRSMPELPSWVAGVWAMDPARVGGSTLTRPARRGNRHPSPRLRPHADDVPQTTGTSYPSRARTYERRACPGAEHGRAGGARQRRTRRGGAVPVGHARPRLAVGPRSHARQAITPSRRMVGMAR